MGRNLLPSGYVKIAIENGPFEIVGFPMKNGGSFHSYVYVLPEGTIFGRNTHPFVCSDLVYHPGVLMKIAISECQPWIMSNNGLLIRGTYPSVVMMHDA